MACKSHKKPKEQLLRELIEDQNFWNSSLIIHTDGKEHLLSMKEIYDRFLKKIKSDIDLELGE